MNNHRSLPLPMTRTWTRIGVPYTADKQESLAALFDHLDWQPFPVKVGFSEGYAIQAIINEFKIPTITELAISHVLAPFGLYGLHCQYANGRAKVYILDRGLNVFVIASDFWPNHQPHRTHDDHHSHPTPPHA